MMNVFFKQGGGVCRKDISSTDSLDLPQEVLWIDLLHPSTAEVSHIAQTYTLDIPTKEEREEIEQSARYFEDTQSITINTYFLMRSASMDLQNETVTFILFQGILFTIRYADFKVFGEIQQSVLLSPRSFEDGYDILSKIFEVRVEQDADMLEGAAQLTKLLRKAVFDEEASDHTAQLAKLSNLQEFNLSVRDSLFDKRRAITALLKSYKVDPEIKKDLSIVLKDLNSLVEFTTVNLNMLDNTQSLFASRVNIEQNKIIKLFTVATMAMMPPTLVGTIYGMNFKYMPELEWEFGYPMVIIVMIVSTVIPIWYFKKKGWL
ncbi:MULTISPECIES: magnesium/cobalt transporter CorA [Helicobacter]|uniref:Magnesium transport protein CorA n=2 Tax=Helicobacter TaxID=209 RepID=A0A377J5E9_9HELI|nr:MULTISPECIES: magnesium/cobalt transporter CorA [Helicobacter]MDL0080312.1 magnesium/cobalt transporter CorA [Helicobacter sp. CPD2-1]MDL0082371.1 magnesium/cobalt transporter CorA [Helicobacter sp. XJK30-2]STO97681.1 magnesium and cobalt transport protein [Helicobacter canis]